jgi:hypothetical protein
MRKLLTALALATAVAGLAAACDDPPAQNPCLDIPDGGCPGIDTTNCEDITCTAIYSCQPDGTWVLATACPARDAGVDSSPPPPKEAGPETGTIRKDAGINVPGENGGPNCIDLEMPDCSLGEALACEQDCCGCQDLYVCQDIGWVLWGECGPDGGVLANDAGAP